MSNGKVMIIHLIAGLIKKDLVWFDQLQFHCIKMSKYFPKLYEPFGGDINVKVDLSNYATLKIFHMLILQVLHSKQI